MRMADATSSGIVDGNSSSGESGGEVIDKLFPKCQPKFTHRAPRSVVKVNKVKSRESSNSSDSLRVSTSTQEGDDGKPSSLAGNCARNQSSPVNNNSFPGNNIHIIQPSNYGQYSSHNTSNLNLYLLSFSPVKSTCDSMTTDNVNMNNECKPAGNDSKTVNGGSNSVPKVINQVSKEVENDGANLRNRVDNVLVSPTEELQAWSSKKHPSHPYHPPHYHNSHRAPSYRHSKPNRRKNTHNKVMVKDDDDDSRDDSMRDDSSSPSHSIRSNISHKRGKKCKKISSNKFKVRSVPVSSEEDIAIKMVEGDNVMDTDSISSSSPGQEPEIARVIGNIPIPMYEGSPRRYGPKQPGSSQRIFPNEYDVKQSNETEKERQEEEGVNSSKEVDSLYHDFKPTFDISCDELLKSILSIPLSSGDSSKTSSAAMELPTKEIDDSCKDDEKIPDCTRKDNKDGEERRNDDSKEEEETAAGSVNQPKQDPVTNHENELILLHQRVHQHLLQELTAGPFHSKTSSAKDHHTSKTSSSKNFTLSPETTDCDSNEVESEYSLSSGSKLLHLPILEDGLSSGLPSPDTEYDDTTSLSSSKHPKQKIKKGGNWSGSGPGETRSTRSGNYNGIVSAVDSDEKKQSRSSAYINHKGHINHQENDLSNDQIPTGESVGGEDGSSSHRFVKESSSRMVPSTRMRRSRSLVLDSIGSDHKSNDPQQVVSNDSSPRRGGKSIEQTEHTGLPSDENNKLGVRSRGKNHRGEDECDTDQETDRLLGAQREERPPSEEKGASSVKRKNASREGRRHDPKVLIEGVLFRARYLGSTQLICEGQPTKATRMMQAEEAVSRIKSLAPEGETQPSTEVDLFISTEKIMVLNTDLKEIMMDHSLRTISYIADIGDLLVLMARRRLLTPGEEKEIKRVPKMICHVFESEEAQFIAQSIGQAFQVAYMEFLKANGIEDSSFVKEMDYQEVLNSQEIFGDELEMFAKKDKQKEVIVPKQKNEILGMVIVESGWGSMLPTVVIANMAPGSPSARCGHLNIGDQIIAINGVSLVGLPLSTCQNYVKSTKAQTAVKLTVVPCAPVVEVKIKRPDTKYQLGFSVQNGVICSLLRGGIAERGGVRVGHRIIEINGQSVVAVPHERIVNLLATSVGEITMKTMPTSMFRLLTGQEAPQYM